MSGVAFPDLQSLLTALDADRDLARVRVPVDPHLEVTGIVQRVLAEQGPALLFEEPSPAPAKYWLARAGLIDSAEVRLPMVDVGVELAARLDAEIARRAPPMLRRA